MLNDGVILLHDNIHTAHKTQELLQKLKWEEVWRRECRLRHLPRHLIKARNYEILRDFEVSVDGGEISMINRLHNDLEKPLYLRLKLIDRRLSRI
ncbi:hypothetical protein AVEN_130259-1 [Araneus ventricosus]|uniref:Uncharacterized protein n=1 Tax=Araneus ventricosus TaxID=182803 RepID=A0A4Y2FP74_ARAVE|nr:hypothetical protein AVEN_130259-1 [Araneus ventricosus]